MLRGSPLCVLCLPDRATPATHVDHIVPLAQGGEMWDRSNLQSLCAKCHYIKTGHEKHRPREFDERGLPLRPRWDWA